MKKTLILTLMLFYSSISQAYDCENVPPFTPMEQMNIKISLTRFFWEMEDGKLVEKTQQVCEREGTVSAYDIRGREEEAFYCLKALDPETFMCATIYKQRYAFAITVPASWIRKTNEGDRREFRFHTYVVPDGNHEAYLDIFGRTLSPNLEKQEIRVESSVKPIPHENEEGFFVRAEFSPQP